METVRVCQEILPDEERMTDFIQQSLPTVVRDAPQMRAEKNRAA